LLYESEKFSQKKLAALLLSKVYYYLGEFNAAVEYALGAEDLFDLNKSQSSQYIDTIIGIYYLLTCLSVSLYCHSKHLITWPCLKFAQCRQMH
jgi:hypothetical protein